MCLNRLTRRSLNRELNRFVRHGRDEYLRRNDITNRRGTSYFIEWAGDHCDMKAVVHIAAGRPNCNPISQQVARSVRNLGFTVIDADGSPRFD